MTQPSEVRSVKVTYNGVSVTATEATWQSAADTLIAQYGAGHGIPDVRFVEAEPVTLALVRASFCEGCEGPVEKAGETLCADCIAVHDADVAAATAVPIAVCNEDGMACPPGEATHVLENVSKDGEAPTTTMRAIKGGEHDIIGEARSKTDLEAARAAGFAPRATVYTRGTRVIDVGVENARLAREEYEAKPLVSECCQDLVTRVQAEEREDHTVNLADIRMTEAGLLDTPVQVEGMAIEERAFWGLVSDLRMPAGAGSFLSQVWPELRAKNINDWCQEWAKDEAEEGAAYQAEIDAGVKDAEPAEPTTLVLRTRVSGGESRAVFGSVTESYTSWDVDKIAKAIGDATPDGARGTVTYDGYRARFEVLFHTTVRPEDFVAGEFFRAGVIVTTDDTGGGSIRGNAVVWQNLCLNLIIIDRAEQDLFRIRHTGSIDRLVKQFSDGFARGLAKLDHFIKAWSEACKDDVLADLPKNEAELVKNLSLRDALPGLFNGAIERELVPVRGRRVEAVKHLVQAWDDDHSSATVHHGGVTRAAIANAFTRYAHTVEQPSPWIEDEIQRAAGALVQSGERIPYLPIKLV